MNGLKATHFLLVAVVACTATISCSPSDSRVGSEKAGKRVLTRDKIIKAADSVFRRRAFPPEYVAFFDEGNARWRESAGWWIWPIGFDERGQMRPRPEVTGAELDAAIVRKWPVLSGHAYQVIEYGFPPVNGASSYDGGARVLVDKNTGEVLVMLDAFGRMISSE